MAEQEEKDPPEFPSNSIMKKDEEEPERTRKPIASAKRIVKKKSWFESVFGEGLKSVGEYVIFEILVPAAKSTVSEIIHNASDMIIYGEARGRRDRDRYGNKTHVSYQNYYDRGDRRERRPRERVRSRNSMFGLDEIFLDTRGDANDVLEMMYAVLDEYGVVTVAEYLELVDMRSEYTDQNYGWDNLRSAEVRHEREGYWIDLPEPVHLD